jgi:ubiquinone/menaquinone biosynthesis C-methylase UbiE
MAQQNEAQRKAVIKETFDIVAGNYDSSSLRFFTASSRHLASILKLKSDSTVLDIATGTGNAALSIATLLPKGHVIGIDFSSKMLGQARQKASTLSIKNVTFTQMDMQSLDFAPESFDAALSAFGIFFVDDMNTQLSKIAAVVKPGGTIAICNFCENYFNPLREMMIKRLISYNVQIPPQTWKQIANETGCRELFEKAGIRNINIERRNMGYYLSSEKEWQEVIMNAGFRRMISQLKPADLEHFWQKHLKEVSSLATKDGIWLDVEVLYTTGVK